MRCAACSRTVDQGYAVLAHLGEALDDNPRLSEAYCPACAPDVARDMLAGGDLRGMLVRRVDEGQPLTLWRFLMTFLR